MREYRRAIVTADAHRLNHVLGCPRDHDAYRQLPVVRAARRVESAVAWPEPHLASNRTCEIVLKAAHVDLLKGGGRRGEAPVRISRNAHQTGCFGRSLSSSGCK